MAERSRARSKFPSVQLVLLLVAVFFQLLTSADETEFLGEDFIILVCSPCANSVLLHARRPETRMYAAIDFYAINIVFCSIRVLLV